MFFKKISIFLLFGFLASFITITKGMENDFKKKCTDPNLTPIPKESSNDEEKQSISDLDITPKEIFDYGNELFWKFAVDSANFLIGLKFMIGSGFLIVANSSDTIPVAIRLRKTITYKGCKFYQPISDSKSAFSDLNYVLVPNVETWNNLKTFIFTKIK